MNTMRDALQEYLTLRRSLGFKLEDVARVLARFVAFMEDRQALHITTKLALEWVQQAQTVLPAERARRLGFIRGFARHRSATDPLTEVPPREVCPYRSTRARPYLYSEEEVKDLLAAALCLPTAWPSTPLRSWVFHCLLGLLSVTGLRISEALDLKLEDVDLTQGLLTIRSAKFGRSRLVPVHPTTRTALDDYLQRVNSSLVHDVRISCLFPTAEHDSMVGAFVEPSTRCRGNRACGRSGVATAPGCTISDTALPFRHSPAGTSRVRIQHGDYQSSRPISGTSMSPVLIGI
jgi:site-specific recombinase XerD